MEGATSMKNLFKISLLSLCILFLSDSVICSTEDTAPLKADEGYQIQPTSISDITYTVFIWTENGGIVPKYFPQFEFDAGDVFKATSVSSEYSELTGTWTETDFAIFTHFTARVEASDETTTTTTAAPSATQDILIPQSIEPEQTSFLINLWGISFDFTPPAPFDTIAFNLLIGAGSYLGANVAFSGFAGTQPDVPKFGSISPDEGQQEQSYTDVEITGVNTTFQDDGVDDIAFSPPDDITISNISTISNTKIEFDLEIDVNAAIGLRSVTVTYDGGNQIISGSNVFEVLPK
jgi:hypothetical protein